MKRLAFTLLGVLLYGCSSAPVPGARRNPATDPSGGVMRTLYAIDRNGTVSVYDIDHGHRLIKTIPTVTNAEDVRGAVASAETGKIYVSYMDSRQKFAVYCLNILTDEIDWVQNIAPGGADRLAISPDGKKLFVPLNEQFYDLEFDYFNVLNTSDGSFDREVKLTTNTHDAQFPLRGPLFMETKNERGDGNFLFRLDTSVDPYSISKVGPYSGILGPFAVDSESRYVVNNVLGLWGFEVADLVTGKIVQATIPGEVPRWDHDVMIHGIGWSPDEKYVWEAGSRNNPFIYVWDMLNPMEPKLVRKVPTKTAGGIHWLNFSIRGDYAYLSSYLPVVDPTEIIDARTYRSIGKIVSSEDLFEIDFKDGKVVEVGDQYGIGRKKWRELGMRRQ